MGLHSYKNHLEKGEQAFRFVDICPTMRGGPFSQLPQEVGIATIEARNLRTFAGLYTHWYAGSVDSKVYDGRAHGPGR